MILHGLSGINKVNKDKLRPIHYWNYVMLVITYCEPYSAVSYCTDLAVSDINCLESGSC